MDIQKKFDAVKKSKTFNSILKKFDLKNKKVLDLGCGYGEHSANFGNGSIGITTTKLEVEYGENNNLNIIYGNVELIDEIHLRKDFEIIWANNFFEHILSPHSFLIKLKKNVNNEGVLILGVPVIPKIISLLRINKFRGSLASNHINFFTKQSLELTIERAGWEIKETKSFVFKNNFLDRIFTAFFSPHIYIIAKNNANFKYPIKKIKEWEDDLHYKNLLDITRQIKL